MTTVGILVLLFVAVASGFSVSPKDKEKENLLKDIAQGELSKPSKSAENKLDTSIEKLNFKKEDLVPKKEDVLSKKEDVIPKKDAVNSKKKDVLAKKEDVLSKKEDVLAKKEDVKSKKEKLYAEQVGGQLLDKDLSTSDQNESEDEEFEEIYENGKAPKIQLLPPYSGEEKEDRREPQVLNGFGQNQKASNTGGIGIIEGYLGFGHFNKPSKNIHAHEPVEPVSSVEVQGKKREPQVLNGFGQNQEAANGGGIRIQNGHLGFGDFNNPELAHVNHPNAGPKIA